MVINPREVDLISDLTNLLRELLEEANLKIVETLARNEKIIPESTWNSFEK